MKYKVGDRVMVKNSYNNIGSIVEIDKYKNAPYKIETDSRIIIWTIESLLELVGSPEYINAHHKKPTFKVSKDIYDFIHRCKNSIFFSYIPQGYLHLLKKTL